MQRSLAHGIHALFVPLLAVAVSACGPSPSTLTASPLPLASQTESFAPQIFAANGEVSLSWLETRGEGHALQYATWTGDAWTRPRSVATGANWFANSADMPGVRALADGRWLAWWLRKSRGMTYAYDIRYALSADGKAWRTLGSPHHDGTPTEHGFVSVIDRPGGFALVWLDGRNTQALGGHHGNGAMTLRFGDFDADGRQTVDTELDGSVCDCCQTDAATTPDGILVAYRDRTENEIRDIHVMRLENGAWRQPGRVHADGWKIDGCPVNGPAIAAEGERVAVAWFTAADDQPQVRVALSDDGGRTFGDARRVDDGHALGRVDVVMHPRLGPLVSWVEKRSGTPRIAIAPVSPQASGSTLDIAALNESAVTGFPRMAVLEDGRVLIAWTNAADGARRVRTAILRP